MKDLNSISAILEPVFQKYKVEKAVVFGSCAKGMATDRSDVDLCVDSGLHGLRFVGLIEEIRRALGGRDVDVLDVSHIENGSRVSEEIRNTGVVIYG